MWIAFMDTANAFASPPKATGPSVHDTHQYFAVRRLDQVIPFVDIVVAAMRRLGWSPHDIMGVRLALEEAVVNGLRHGNKGDASKCVRISYRVRAEDVIFAVQDEGAGFDFDNVPDPRSPENWDCPSGRGLLLMRHYMTTVEFADGGKRVILSKIRAQ